MKTSTILLLGAAAGAIFLASNEAPSTGSSPNATSASQTYSEDIKNIEQGTTASRFDSEAVNTANILQRALDEGVSAADTLAQLQPNYIDPAFTASLTGIPDATRVQLEAQKVKLLASGGYYDMVNAQAIEDYLDGIVKSVYTSPRGGINEPRTYNEWKQNNLV